MAGNIWGRMVRILTVYYSTPNQNSNAMKKLCQFVILCLVACCFTNFTQHSSPNLARENLFIPDRPLALVNPKTDGPRPTTPPAEVPVTGKVTDEKMFVDRHLFNADDTDARFEFDDLIDQQKRVSMGQYLLDRD